MKITEKNGEPALIVEYHDEREDFNGWLVIDALDYRLCAGGMRVQPGLSREHLIEMARNMTRKMRMANLRVNGAKSGIDYDPANPGKQAAITRFMQAIKSQIQERYSMGPDLNVEMSELEKAGREIGLPSVKMAIAAAQNWEMEYYLQRASILSAKIDNWSLGRLRAGYGVAAAVLSVLDYSGIPPANATLAIQGFGTLAKAAAYGLIRAGAKIIAIADREKCLVAKDGHSLNMELLLQVKGGLLPASGHGDHVEIFAKEKITEINCDILVPAAVENTITGAIASNLPVKIVVPGANLAVSAEAVEILYERGIIVLPDFLAGSGGSLSMEGLFGPAEHPEPLAVLNHVKTRMDELVLEVLNRSIAARINPTEAALLICGERQKTPGTRPYGNPEG
ncbi:MAG: Glu/Leu/Phe/Val dehydrogenase [Proteobacteria bacterium]|nr:Glu/Leu/Phe/Val dehydrogenase [Pseudomonadota bacterium]MBU1714047.1 Glu/Leu/Phe/Val dehydrogenase [Pseudomonadota bacterium]